MTREEEKRAKDDQPLTSTLSEPPRFQRIQATGRVSAVFRDGRTRLERLYQEGAAKIRLPRLPGTPLEAVLINTGGGLTGGDRLEWNVEAGPGATVIATTQACEKVYRSSGGEARVTCNLKVGEGGFLAWIPQETILFDQSALTRRLEIDLAPGARALIVESAIFGRTAMGERVVRARFRDHWRLRVGGRLIHAENLAFDGAVDDILRERAGGNGAIAMATVLLIGEGAIEMLPSAQALLGPQDGVSAWSVGGSGKLLARLLARDGHALRQGLIPLMRLLNGEAGLPKIWSS